jgi:hypothetical protein
MSFKVSTDIMRKVFEKVNEETYRPARIVRQKVEWREIWNKAIEEYFLRFEKVDRFPTLTPWFPGRNPANEDEKTIIRQFADVWAHSNFIQHLIDTEPGEECVPNVDENLKVCGEPIVLTNIVERFLWRINGFSKFTSIEDAYEDACNTRVRPW